jgi:hypothetical protein
MKQREVSGIYNTVWPDGIREELTKLEEPIEILDELADAFRLVGNRATANTLDMVSGMIYQSKEKIGRAVAEKCIADVKQVDQASHNMLMAGIAGIEVASKKHRKSGGK